MGAFDRSTTIRGPAIITLNSIVFYTAGNILVTPKIIVGNVPTAIHGNADMFLDDILTEITFVPAGKWEGLTTLWPHTTPSIGSSIFGATDKNVTIQTLAGQLETWKAGAVTQMPDIILSATKTLIGQVTITCIGANNTAWTDAAKRNVIAAQVFSDTSFNPADLIKQAYTVAWGSSSPWNAINTEEGVVISPSMSIAWHKSDDQGTYDATLEDVGVTAKLTPVGVSESQLMTLLKLQGAGVLRGASLGTLNGDVFNAYGTGVYVRIYKSVPTLAPLRHDRGVNRAGQLEFVGVRTYSAGALQPLFYVGTAAPA